MLCLNHRNASTENALHTKISTLDEYVIFEVNNLEKIKQFQDKFLFPQSGETNQQFLYK